MSAEVRIVAKEDLQSIVLRPPQALNRDEIAYALELDRPPPSTLPGGARHAPQRHVVEQSARRNSPRQIRAEGFTIELTALVDTADTAELIISNARITTMDKDRRRATAVAIAGGKVLAVGCSADIARYAGEGTRRIDARGRTMVPGHDDSLIHLIRGGLNCNLELRWEGVPSLADASAAKSSSALESPHVG